mgnify:CR=1 FL=1
MNIFIPKKEKRGCYEIVSSKGSVLTAFLLSIFSDFFLLGFTFGNSSPGVSSGSSYFTSAFVLPLMKLNNIISSSAFRIPVLLKRTFDMSSFMIPNTPSDCMDLSILMRIPSEVFDISQSHFLKREGENDECKHPIGVVGLLAYVGPISEDRRGDDGTDPRMIPGR